MILLGSNHYLSAGSTNTHAIQFRSASNQYCSISDNASLSITGDMTIEAWVKMPTGLWNGAGSYMMIASKTKGTGNQRSYQFYIAEGLGAGGIDKVAISISSDGTSGNQTTSSWSYDFSEDTYYHVALSYDASAGEVSLYVNASLQSTISGQQTSIYDSTAGFFTGRNTSGSKYSDMDLDEFRVWNVARTGTEIANNYNKELVGNESGLVAYYQFNNNANDLTTNNNDLTENNSPVYSTDTPF